MNKVRNQNFDNLCPSTSLEKLSEAKSEGNGYVQKKQDKNILQKNVHQQKQQVLNIEHMKILEDRAFYCNKNALKQIKRKKIKRLQQHKCWYLYTILATILLGTQNLYIFLWDFRFKDVGIYFPTIILRIVLFFLGSRELCSEWKVMFKLYFSFDKVLLTIVAQSIGVIAFCKQYINYAQFSWFYSILIFLNPLLLFSFAGYFRIILVFARWSKCQTIIMKIALLIGGTSYFGLSMYYIFIDGKFTKGEAPQLDKIIKNLLFLYAFAGFDFYLECFSIMDQVDGTTYFKHLYHLECSQQNMQFLLHGHKIQREGFSKFAKGKQNTSDESPQKLKKYDNIILT